MTGKSIIVPLEFFKAIGEKPAIIRIIWIKWLSEYTEELFKPDFIESFHFIMKDKNLSLETIIEAYNFGIGFFEGGFIFSKYKGEKDSKSYPKDIMYVVNDVILYLNQSVGSTYTTSKANIDCIVARIKEGYTIGHFKRVIDKKSKQWINGEQAKYLRPITLFQAKKFENYLNEPEISENATNQHKSSSIDKLTKAANKAKQFFN